MATGALPKCGPCTRHATRLCVPLCQVSRRATGGEHSSCWPTSRGLRVSALRCVEYSALHGNWLTVPAKFSKGSKGLRQYVHPVALQHVDAIRTDRAAMLDWPKWDTQKRTAYDTLRVIQAAAGIADSRRWAFHSFRRTHLTQLSLVGTEQGFRMAQDSAGHSDLSTTLDHYVSASAQEQMRAAAINRMPSPVPPVQEDEFID